MFIFPYLFSLLCESSDMISKQFFHKVCYTDTVFLLNCAKHGQWKPKFFAKSDNRNTF